MPVGLLDHVNEDLLPRIPSYRFKVEAHDESTSFGDATVVLRGEDLSVRIVRERGQVFVDIGPTSDSSAWFDSAIVMEYLGLSVQGGFHERDARRVFEGLGNFLNTFRDELLVKFSASHVARTKNELLALREARADRQFGF